MSTTTTKRDRANAKADAEMLRSMFPTHAYSRWEFAGSLRRGKPTVGDVEHVCRPAFGDVTGDGLFAEPTRVNLLFHKLDSLLADGTVTKHVYGTTETGSPLYRWGERYRGVDFRGFNHEFFMADEDNWGAVLLIRTGPAEYSKHVVETFNRRGLYRQHDGYLHAGNGSVVKVPDEQTYLRLAGLPWAEPCDRG